MSDKAILSDIATPRQAGRIASLKQVTKRRQAIYHAAVIRADFDLLADLPPDSAERVDAPPATRARAKTSPAKTPERQAFPPQRRSRPGRGRAGGQGRAIPCSPPAPALRCSTRHLRPDPPAAGALRARLALQSAAASAKILRLNADEGALRDLRFAVGDPLGPAANLLSLWRDLRRPAAQPRPRPDRRRGGAARPGPGGPERPRGKPEGLRRGGDPVSAAAKAAALAFSAFPDAPAAEAEILALWVFDIVLAIRLRWPRPVPLIATKILDPTLRSPGRRSTAKAGRPSLAKRRRGRDRARRRLRPRPRRRSCPPLQDPDRRRAQTAIETGGQNRRPAARPRIASRQPKRRARRR